MKILAFLVFNFVVPYLQSLKCLQIV